MKIGIIVYSQTGNTYSVASKLYETLKSDGKNVEIERIEAIRDMKKNSNVFNITNYPNIDKYDIVVFASYVEAFMLNPVMKKYLESIKSLENKKILCFVTQHFPYAWLGGNNAIKKIKSICESKKASIKVSKVINWSNKKREDMIKNLLNEFKECINEK